MTDRGKVIKGLKRVSNDIVDGYITEPDMACNTINDAIALLKMQKDTINELYALYDDLCKDIRQKYESDDVCGLCQYDGAYVGESGDWMNECPGFETNECFCMKNSIRKMCGKPLIEEP